MKIVIRHISAEQRNHKYEGAKLNLKMKVSFPRVPCSWAWLSGKLVVRCERSTTTSQRLPRIVFWQFRESYGFVFMRYEDDINLTGRRDSSSTQNLLVLWFSNIYKEQICLHSNITGLLAGTVPSKLRPHGVRPLASKLESSAIT